MNRRWSRKYIGDWVYHLLKRRVPKYQSSIGLYMMRSRLLSSYLPRITSAARTVEAFWSNPLCRDDLPMWNLPTILRIFECNYLNIALSLTTNNHLLIDTPEWRQHQPHVQPSLTSGHFFSAQNMNTISLYFFTCWPRRVTMQHRGWLRLNR